MAMAFKSTMYFVKEWNMNVLLMACATVLSVVFVTKYARKIQNVPSGPRGLPIIGNLLDIYNAGTAWGSIFQRWSKQYGDVFRLTLLGQSDVLVISKQETIRTFLGHPLFQTRTPPITAVTALGPGKGLTSGSGPTWQKIRSMSSNVFTDLGVGKTGSKVEDLISKEAKILLKELDQVYGKESDISNKLLCACLNVLTGILFGKHIGYSEQEMFANTEVNSKFFSLGGPGGINFTSNFLATLPIGPGQRVIHVIRWIIKVWTKNVEEHKLRLQNENGEDKPLMDYVDAFLRKIKQSKGTEEMGTFNEINLRWILKDLHFSGVEPVVSTLRWAILLLAVHSEVQKKCQAELDHVLDGQRDPLWSDRSNTPYINATLTEVARVGAVATFCDYRNAEEDCMVSGYFVPKGTRVLVNWYSHFYDSRYWDEPQVFNPERHLSKDGTFVKSDILNQYGEGERACFGANLAEMELYLLLSNLLHRSTFALPDSCSVPDIQDAVYGYTRAPVPYKVILTKRN